MIDTKATGHQPFFVDSYAPLTEAAVEHLLSVSGGVMPLAWGRYMDANLCADLDVAAKYGFPLILIARRSSRVPHPEYGAPDGARDRGLADHWAREAAARGASVVRAVFLDVEMEPTMHAAYYRAWAAGFDGAKCSPAVYMPNRNYWPASWVALESAVASGARCAGTWVALYHQETEHGTAVLRDEAWATRPQASDRVPYLGWQHTGNAYQKQYDFSVPNPDASQWLADTLPAHPETIPAEPPRADSADPAPLTSAAQDSSDWKEVP